MTLCVELPVFDAQVYVKKIGAKKHGAAEELHSKK